MISVIVIDISHGPQGEYDDTCDTDIDTDTDTDTDTHS